MTWFGNTLLKRSSKIWRKIDEAELKLIEHELLIKELEIYEKKKKLNVNINEKGDIVLKK